VFLGFLAKTAKNTKNTLLCTKCAHLCTAELTRRVKKWSKIDEILAFFLKSAKKSSIFSVALSREK
jgi:hypothetical protein